MKCCVGCENVNFAAKGFAQIADRSGAVEVIGDGSANARNDDARPNLKSPAGPKTPGVVHHGNRGHLGGLGQKDRSGLKFTYVAGAIPRSLGKDDNRNAARAPLFSGVSKDSQGAATVAPVDRDGMCFAQCPP